MENERRYVESQENTWHEVGPERKLPDGLQPIGIDYDTNPQGFIRLSECDVLVECADGDMLLKTDGGRYVQAKAPCPEPGSCHCGSTGKWFVTILSPVRAAVWCNGRGCPMPDDELQGLADARTVQ